VIEERLRTAESEIGYKEMFDYIVVNDDADRAAREVMSIIADIKKDKE
jgi:guanylate kinase